ncbi:cytochrome c oxidase subunit 3 [Geochorda subterranea]|uniref:Cytochrome c oxidase subunit 3 n=1 Tax=Geochorda subterranea TaxID=3109564 RepID=A0ABZ1BL02_9FIRM|nr:cytochrome c oxidase subunit 3 [Limnochorda sp. LNt]WRP13245.1 cytochrome c oxidase subunit 3 [Limnochorda sp. LNt]
MQATPTSATTERADWGGGVSPFRVTWSKLMMWLFLLSDTLTFGSLLVGYGYLRMSNPAWPRPDEVFNVGLVGFMTFVLICSSATMAMAVAAARRDAWPQAVRLLGLTVLGGLLFLGLQAYEWRHFIHEGARLSGNPWGVPLFSATFFVITGFHGLHVTAGVVYLTTVVLRALRRRYTADGVEVAGLYWHFVDLVWVFIFTLMYLI